MRYTLKTPLAGLLLAIMTASPAFAEPDNREVVYDNNGHLVVNSFNNCVRTEWRANNDACGGKKVRARHELTKEERTVYFPFNKATLTSRSTSTLNTLAETLKSDDQVRQARIIGYADRMGTASYNEALSKKRANAVRNYLIARGFINSRVAETRWLGESVPVTNCPSTLSRNDLIACLQKDRRVEVEIDYNPEGQRNR